jgi:hypothetical protein
MKSNPSDYFGKPVYMARRRFVWVEVQPWALVGLAGPRIG